MIYFSAYEIYLTQRVVQSHSFAYTSIQTITMIKYLQIWEESTYKKLKEVGKHN